MVGGVVVFLSLYLSYRFHMSMCRLGMGDIGFGRSVCTSRRNGLECTVGVTEGSF